MSHIPDTTLLLMVRDELINPAGGLGIMVEHHTDIFEQLVIVDTGSQDGTVELLEHLSYVHDNVDVYHMEFEGFGPTRQKLLGLADTRLAFSLDADEMLFSRYVPVLHSHLTQCAQGYNLRIHYVNETTNHYVSGWNPRLYDPRRTVFGNALCFEDNSVTGKVVDAYDVVIHHFVPDHASQLNQKGHFYLHVENGHFIAPSSMEDFLDWKMPNIRLLESYGVDFPDYMDNLRTLGIPLPTKVTEYLDSATK